MVKKNDLGRGMMMRVLCACRFIMGMCMRNNAAVCHFMEMKKNGLVGDQHAGNPDQQVNAKVYCYFFNRIHACKDMLISIPAYPNVLGFL